ncbi:hypothetical protein AMECASPLE_020186 [Ameca splendens]|uniref:Uncharacterized protein n=1 Tax=Ameca splendens TaxID=208324 RepID=A0ABV1AAG9_9TELE
MRTRTRNMDEGKPGLGLRSPFPLYRGESKRLLLKKLLSISPDDLQLCGCTCLWHPAGAGLDWLDLGNVKGGVNTEMRRQLETDRGRTDDEFDFKWAKESGCQFSGVSLQRKVLRRQPNILSRQQCSR